ncbi:MAG TPA: Uma2 family endonuclease [Polyangiaceae bacterium LLY-WYZ-14_1]|nr:Uma2 family endonuclease [Polyangiaceae bacterium LLY-WYZ-14_1]
MDSARRLASYDDLCALPEGVRGEVVAGAVRTEPAPLPRHSRVAGALRRFIGGPYDDDDGFGGPGGWWIFLGVDVRLAPQDIVRPDLAGWRRERLPEPWETRPIDARPDWVCEVLSPGNLAHDRVTKHELYRQHGIPHYWIVDPVARVLEAMTLRDGDWVVPSYDDTAESPIPPFEAVSLPVGRLFPPAPSP